MNDQVAELLQDMKRMWALSLAQLDNTSGRKGIEMQREYVEEMCARSINPKLERLLASAAGIQPATALALPVVEDPRDLPAQARNKNRSSAKAPHRRGGHLQRVA